MKKANVEKIQTMMAGFLQYRWMIYLKTSECIENGTLKAPECGKSPDEFYYEGAVAMIEACGGNWYRDYTGGDSDADRNNINNYRHTVILPDDATCDRLNVHAWDI